MSVLVFADHDNQALKGILNTVAAAQVAGGESIDLLVAGSGCGAVAEEAAKVAGVAKVICADAEAYKNALAENLADLVVELARLYPHLGVASTTGKNFMPRVAALLDVAQISDICGVESADTFKRHYAGNAIATVKSNDAIKVMTKCVLPPLTQYPQRGSASVESSSEVKDAGVSQFASEELAKSDRPELSGAKVVISGGRGMQNGDNFKMLEGIADKLGAAMGAAVDAGYSQ